MTTDEFSDAFDVALGSYDRVALFGQPGSIHTVTLNEYEKSVFLTRAQEEVARGLYDGTLNGEPFEGTEQARSALQGLIRTETLESVDDGPSPLSGGKTFKLPDDVWYVTYEAVTLHSGSYCDDDAIEVTPVRQDEWHKTRRDPFRRPNERRAARLDSGQGYVEIVAAYPVTGYTVRYLRKPRPIILEDIDDPALSIDGRTEVTQCELGVMSHRLILDRAVQLALARFGINMNNRQ